MVNPIRSYSDDDEITKARNDQEDYLFDGLSQYVLRCFKRAQEFREQHGVDSDIAYCLRAYKSKYSADEAAKFEGIGVYRGVTGMLCRTAESWLEDAYAMVSDKPWTIEPTPEPTLPATIRQALDQVMESRLNYLRSSGAVLQMTTSQQYDVIRALKQEAERMASEEATKALVGMDKKIQDQLLEGDWAGEFAKFRHDIMIYPTAVIKYGSYRNRKVAEWDGDSMSAVNRTVRVVERVAANDIFPSPDSTTTQDGEYVIERMHMSRTSLIKCIGLPYFFREALRLVIYDNPEGVRGEGFDSGKRLEWLEIRKSDDENMYVVYDFHGRVRGEDILAFYNAEGDSELAKREDGTVDTPLGDIDPFSTYEMNVWLCGGKVIRMLMAPDPLDQRPYAATSYCKVPGSFWGMSIPMLLESLQHELNTAARSRAYNMGIASGPIVEIDVDRLPTDDKPQELQPWRIFYTTAGAGQGSAPAIRFNQANSNTGELTAVMEEAWNKAHDIVGLPPYTRGVNDGAARTLGAFSMQYNAATKGIKRVIGNVDRDVIEPVVISYYYYNMFYDEDATIKADAQITARGTLGLLRKEAKEAKPLETLMQTQGLAQNYPQMVEFLLREFITERGYDPAQLGLSSSLLTDALGPSRADQNAPAGSPELSQPALDGRSGPAQQAIEASTIPG